MDQIIKKVYDDDRSKCHPKSFLTEQKMQRIYPKTIKKKLEFEVTKI